jgi:hypothetical protein
MDVAGIGRALPTGFRLGDVNAGIGFSEIEASVHPKCRMQRDLRQALALSYDTMPCRRLQPISGRVLACLEA